MTLEQRVAELEASNETLEMVLHALEIALEERPSTRHVERQDDALRAMIDALEDRIYDLERTRAFK